MDELIKLDQVDELDFNATQEDEQPISLGEGVAIFGGGVGGITEEELNEALDKKLDKPEVFSNNALMRYNKETGQITSQATYQGVPANGQIPVATVGGAVNVGTPTEDGHAVNKKYAEENFVNKITNDTTMNVVYGEEYSNRGQKIFTLQSGGTNADTIPMRNANGQFDVRTPQSDLNVANKQYVDNLFNGANKAVSFINYSAMITSLNILANNSYSVGQNIMIVTLQVPDLWVSEISETSVNYTYVSDDDFVNELTTNGYVQVGYYKLSALETQKVDLTEYAKLTDLGNKLDKITTPYGASVHRIYAIGTQGQQYVVTTVDSNNIVETKKHSEETYVAQQTPEFDGGATRGYVYFVDPNQNQIVKKVQIQANYDTIPLRNANGNFYVGNPTLPYETTNKAYVDGLVGDINTTLEGILGV